VHVGGSTVEDAVELAQHAKELGADGTSSVVPENCPNDLGAAFEYFSAIGAVGLPFYCYWRQATAAQCTAEQYLETMSKCPNFSGIKYTAYDFYTLQTMMDLPLGKHLNCVSGPDEMNLAAKCMGVHGAIGTTYNVQCVTFVKMQEAYDKGDMKTAEVLQLKANRVIRKLLASVNIISAVKAVMRHQGLPAGHAKLATSRRLTEEESAALFTAVAELGIE